jgi:hypothetical protein
VALPVNNPVVRKLGARWATMTGPRAVEVTRTWAGMSQLVKVWCKGTNLGVSWRVYTRRFPLPRHPAAHHDTFKLSRSSLQLLAKYHSGSPLRLSLPLPPRRSSFRLGVLVLCGHHDDVRYFNLKFRLRHCRCHPASLCPCQWLPLLPQCQCAIQVPVQLELEVGYAKFFATLLLLAKSARLRVRLPVPLAVSVPAVCPSPAPT